MFFNIFDHARRFSKTAWKWKDCGPAAFETIMTPRWFTYGMSTNMQQGPKWKSANYRLKSRNDEVVIIKQSREECKEDQN